MEPLSTGDLIFVATWLVSGLISGVVIWRVEDTFDTIGDFITVMGTSIACGYFTAFFVVSYCIDQGIAKIPKLKFGAVGQKCSAAWNYKLKK